MIKDIFKFIFALVLFIPFSILVLIAYGGMMLIKEVLVFMGEWEE